MAVASSKLKTLYIMKELMEKSDEEHVLSAEDLNKGLLTYGLSADRKTIYSDIETLQAFGLDIVQVRGGAKPGYYIGTRDFELAELKLLVDAVQASKFITARKSRELIEKIEKLTSISQAKQLQRDVFIFNRLKTGNETIYYSVDQIHAAISGNRQIRFQYTEWSPEKKLIPKKDGAAYVVSPWALTWNDENYYLIAYEENSDKIKHYRVDKMKDVQTLEEERLGREVFDGFNPADFAKKTFRMYGGTDRRVSLLCERKLIGVILDRFGTDVIVAPVDEEHFKVTVTVSISPQFFGWVTALGNGVKIEGPEEVRAEYRKLLDRVAEMY